MKKRLLLLVIPVTLIILMVTNPAELSFLERVSVDYGALHHGMTMDREMLLSLGESRRSSYLLCSRYEYRFGRIAVHYFGVASMVFYLGSSVSEPPSTGASDTVEI